MNRRELFKGLAAAIAAAGIPVTVEYIAAIPDGKMLAYLRSVRDDIFNRLINPPMLMAEDGTITTLEQSSLHDALKFVLVSINNLEHGEPAIARIDG